MSAAERRRKAKAMYRRKPRPSMREIAADLGVSVGTVHRDLNPEAAERYLADHREYKRERRQKATERR